MSKTTETTKAKAAKPAEPRAPTVTVQIDDKVQSVIDSVREDICRIFPGQDPTNASLVKTALLRYHGQAIESQQAKNYAADMLGDREA